MRNAVPAGGFFRSVIEQSLIDCVCVALIVLGCHCSALGLMVFLGHMYGLCCTEVL